MIIDIVMPTGGTKGGVEYVLNEWIRSDISKQHELRFFHITPGTVDYLNNYPKQWFLPIQDPDNFHFDLQYCVDAYSRFIKECGEPDICLATWIPLLSTACHIIKDSLHLNMHIVSWIHSGIDVYKQSGWGGIEHLQYADYHLCISGKIQSDILNVYPNAKTFLIGNPVHNKNLAGYLPDDRTLCFVGRLSEEKKVDVILRALAGTEDKSWKLLIAGEGPKEEQLLDITKNLGLNNRVSFLGWQNKPWEAVCKASALIIASDYEGFCISALEASSLGMTVISTPVSGCTDYIIPGNNGYFFGNGNPADLTAILDFISTGKLSFCDQDLCRKSVKPYLRDNYFKHVSDILNDINSDRSLNEL